MQYGVPLQGLRARWMIKGFLFAPFLSRWDEDPLWYSRIFIAVHEIFGFHCHGVKSGMRKWMEGSIYRAHGDFPLAAISSQPGKYLWRYSRISAMHEMGDIFEVQRIWSSYIAVGELFENRWSHWWWPKYRFSHHAQCESSTKHVWQFLHWFGWWRWWSQYQWVLLSLWIWSDARAMRNFSWDMKFNKTENSLTWLSTIYSKP